MKTSAEELRERILERRLLTANERRFFPDAALWEVITEQAVTDVISSTSIHIHQQKGLVEFVLNHAKKIFCILVCLGKVRYIDGFSRSQWVDPGLPFTVENLKDIIGLGGTTAQEFVAMQWEYMAPVFGREDRQLRDAHILPFKSKRGIPKAVGGYGSVREVELYNVHQELVAGSSAETIVVALKELHQEGGNPDMLFERETSVLQLLRTNHHPYIIKLLGSFRQENSYNLFFPLASSDLGKLFTDGHPEFWPRECFYRSIVGLASALNHIHAFKYKLNDRQTIPYQVSHRDLKPANILIVEGRLVIADFGLSKFKDGNMASATVFPGCTPSYEPPESKNLYPDDFSETLVGRGADVWAFGCILSEIATFMISGSKGIKDYKEKRRKSVLPGNWVDECFHASSTQVKEGVKEWLRRLEVESSDDDIEIQKLLRYVTKIMDPNPKSRPNSERVLKMVSNLHPGASSELASLLSRREEPTFLSPPLSPERSPPPAPGITIAQSEVLKDRQDLEILYQGSKFSTVQVDVIAVHGLNGGSLTGWEGGDGSVWLRDFLPIEIPLARIISYGYNSLELFSELSVERLVTAARVFLNRLKRMRESGNARGRPIVLIAHSIGGFLVKQVVVQAEKERHFEDILGSIYGICFFGMPHGETGAPLEANLRKIANIASAPQHTRMLLAECLGGNHRLLGDINQQFSAMGFQIINFFETKATPHLGLVVDKESASMRRSSDVKVSYQGLEATHEGLCKYPTDNDLTYRKVSTKISLLAQSAVAESPYHPEWGANLRNPATSQPPELSPPARQVIDVSNSIGSVFPPQYMPTYPQQTLSSPSPPQQSSQPHLISSVLPARYMPTHLQQTPFPLSPPQKSLQLPSVSSMLPLKYMPTSPQQPPQQSPQPSPITARQAITSIEAKLEVLNKTLSKIGEKKAAREGERKALKQRRQKMGEQNYRNEDERLTNALSRLERQRSDEVAKKDELLVQLQQAKAWNV